ALAVEESRVRQKVSYGGRSRQRYRRGTNDRAERQVRTDELARPRHDQTRGGVWVQVEVRKNQPVATVHGGSISGFVIPDLEVGDLRAADAGDDAQCQQAAALKAKRVVKAGPSLLDHREVERRRIGDGLDLVGGVKALVLNRDGWPINYVDRLFETVAKVRIVRAAVAKKPTGVHVEVSEVGQPSGLDRGNRTARQSAERFQVHRLLVHFDQERVQEILMAEFVRRVLRDVSGHVIVNGFQGVGERPVQIGELRILLPKVRLQDFRGGEESQDGCVTFANRHPLTPPVVVIGE